jgi:hypothetical protein
MSNYLLGAVPFPHPRPPAKEKVSEDHTTNKATPQASVTYFYQAKIAELCRNVTVTWCKNLIHHSLSIMVETPSDGNRYTCKIDLRTWQFWGRKGLKSFELDKKRVDIFWDFRQAKFSNTPEPCSDYYVALVCGQEVVLLLGDSKKEAYKRTRSRPSLEEATLVYKKEIVYGKRLFCTRAMLSYGKKEQDILIETSLSGPGDPEMWISINGEMMIRVINLNWRFRGNETVMVNDLPVQILWDLHDWLHSNPGSGPGLFIFKPGTLECETEIFKPGTLECETESEPDDRNCSNGNDSESTNDSSSTQGSPSTTKFCHFLYAWRTE